MWAGEIPASLLVLGGGPVGVELGAVLPPRRARDVTIVDGNPPPAGAGRRDAGDLLAERLAEEGIQIRQRSDGGARRCDGDGVRLHLEGGETLEAARLLVATGRTPNVAGFGFEQLGLEITKQGISIDDRLRAAEGIWAIGDVSGVALLDARREVPGARRRRERRGARRARRLPCDPGLRLHGSAGRERRQDGRGRRRERELQDHGRPALDVRAAEAGGPVKLAADRSRRVLVGAVTVGPEAGEWLGQLTLAVRAEVPLDVLLDTIQPYPTFSEAIFSALLELQDALSA